MEIGSRVWIQAPGAWCDGQSGVITVDRGGKIVEVQLDPPTRSSSTTINKEFLVKAIDPNKPLRFADHDDKRPVTFVGKMPNGDIVATSTYSSGTPWPEPHAFDKNTGRCAASGYSFVIENAPVYESFFMPMDRTGHPYGRGMTTLAGARADYPNAAAYLEIKRCDGRLSDVELHNATA